MFHPSSAVCATTDTALGEKRVPIEQNQSILKSSGGPLGECRMGTVRILIACGSCGAVVGLAVWAGQLATGGARFLTSLVSSAVIIATAPTLKQSHPARVTLSHAIAMISGIGLRTVLPLSPYPSARSAVVALLRQ